MHLTTLLLVVMVGAVYRSTVILTKDYIAEPVRRFLRSHGNHLTYLSSCPWCCSVWVSAVIVPLTVLLPWFTWVDVALTCSGITAIMYELVNEKE